jgi:SNF2 family DNA or RNA helicase
MLVTILTGGEGLNLTVATTAVICEPWYNPAVESQASARIHRLGQDKPVKIIRLVIRDTIEERIRRIQLEKISISEDMATGFYPVSDKRLTLEELCSLLPSAT